MKKRKSPLNNDAQVDMTPMLDIVFIMLIFFIVSSTFIRETGFDLTEHKSNDEPEQPQKKSVAIEVLVCENDDILVDHRSIDLRSVRANVERKLAEDSAATVIIKTEPQAPTDALVKVMDQARAARASISVSSSPAQCHPNNAT